jgi:MFS family permease
VRHLINIFIPTLMIRDLRANPDVVPRVTLTWCLFLAGGLLLAGYASDRIGRKRPIVGSTVVCMLGFAALYLFGRTIYPNSVLGWTLPPFPPGTAILHTAAPRRGHIF